MLYWHLVATEEQFCSEFLLFLGMHHMPTHFLPPDYVARYRQYTGDPDARQLARFFHLDETDLTRIRQHRGRHQRLGFAIQIGTVRFLGTFLPNPLDVPFVVVQYLAHQLHIDDLSSLPRYLERDDTKWNHAQEIRQLYGYCEFVGSVWQFRLTRWLYQRVWLSNERSLVLFDHAVAWLMQQKVLLPGATTLERLIGSIQERAANRLWHRIARAVPPDHQAQLEALLIIPEGKRQSAFDQLRKAPLDASVRGLLASLRRLQSIRALGIRTLELPSIPEGRFKAIARYALGVRTQTIARLSQHDRKITTLVAWATYLEAMATDDVLDIMTSMIRTVFTTTDRKGQTARLRTLHDLDSAATLLQSVCHMLLDPTYPDMDIRTHIFNIHDPVRVAQAISTIQTLVHPRTEPFDQQLIHHYPIIRRWLPMLMQTITFQSIPSGLPIIEALRFLQALEGISPPKLHYAPPAVVGGRWKRLVLDSGEVIHRQLYTFAVLERLLQSLDRREVFVEPSERWNDPRTKLLTASEWTQYRSYICRILGRQLDAHREVALLDQQLTSAYQQTSCNLETNTALRLEHIDGHDRPIVMRVDKIEESASLRQLRQTTQTMMPQVDLPELLLEIHAMTGFADEFTHLSEQASRVRDLPLSICAVLLAEACNIGIEPLVQPSNPALTRDRLAWVQQNYLRAETLTRANTRLVAAQAQISITHRWGGGDVASVDGMRFVVPVRTIYAGGSPKHFPRERGITWYNGLADQHMGFNALVIPGALRDAPYLLNVLLEQQTHLPINEVMTDTAGYSDTVFGLFWLLGYQFSPRLADLKDMRFWRIDPHADYGHLNDIGRHKIATTVIADHWDDMLRLAGSLKMGTVAGDAVVRWLHGEIMQLFFCKMIQHP